MAGQVHEFYPVLSNYSKSERERIVAILAAQGLRPKTGAVELLPVRRTPYPTDEVLTRGRDGSTSIEKFMAKKQKEWHEDTVSKKKGKASLNRTALSQVPSQKARREAPQESVSTPKECRAPRRCRRKPTEGRVAMNGATFPKCFLVEVGKKERPLVLPPKPDREQFQSSPDDFLPVGNLRIPQFGGGRVKNRS